MHIHTRTITRQQILKRSKVIKGLEKERKEVKKGNLTITESTLGYQSLRRSQGEKTLAWKIRRGTFSRLRTLVSLAPITPQEKVTIR